jgi:predicted RNA-binding protein with PUA-like domain
MTRDSLSKEFNEISISIKKDLDEMNYNLIKLEKELSWISDVAVESSKNTDGVINSKFTWKIKDYIEGAKVNFFYRKTGDNEFRQLAATQEKDGFFSVIIDFITINEPEWDIQYHSLGNYEPKEQNRQSYKYEYYITLNDGNRIMTSDVNKINLRNELSIYSVIDMTVRMKENRFIVDVGFNGDKEIPIKVALEIYNGKEKKEESMEIDREKRFGIWETTETQFDRIVARAEYADGSIHNKEIWNEENIK